MTQTETMEYDVVIVGAGPAGLSSAIRLRQLAQEAGKDISVCVLEKGSEVGAHILSGAVFEPRALDELIPDWKEKGAPLDTPVTEDQFLLLNKKGAYRFPTPRYMKNKGNYIVSMSNLCRWLGQQAEAMGVQIFAGFPAADILLEGRQVVGVVTGEFGRDKDGNKKEGFQPGIEIKAKYTLFAEGCRGSLSEQLIEFYNLRRGVSPQTYGIGIKELWEVDPAKHSAGRVVHSVGWPLDNSTYGGSFMYHLNDGTVAVGFVVGLDYRNPYLDPYMEFQTFKTHPAIRSTFEGGKRISYGARALNEGGYQSIPKLIFPGGAMIGCSAGFMNVPKIKGSHTAMKSGMCAAESVFEALQDGDDEYRLLEDYPNRLRKTWVYKELYEVRNIRAGFHKGLWPGLISAALEAYIFRGRLPWKMPRYKEDHTRLKLASKCSKIDYIKPDGVLTFDRLSSVFLSSTNHEENQPCHLQLLAPSLAVDHNLQKYDAPEQRYCPAGVYEIIEKEGKPELQINAQNCVHCKTCDIKDPRQNIKWVTPEGGGGPNYSGM